MAWPFIRIAAAVVGLSGVLAGLVVNIDRAVRDSQSIAAVLANYFSFFTIISTTAVAVVLIIAATWSLRHQGSSPEPRGIALALAATAGPVLLLGVVYNVLLRGPEGGLALTDPPIVSALDWWAIESLHVVVPLYVLVDLLFAPRRAALPWRSLAVIVGYPLVWAAYTMIRGELVANPDGSTAWWYPYPFLDPHGPGGYPSAFLYIGGILAAFVVIGSLIIMVGRYRAKRRATHGATPLTGAVAAWEHS